MQFDFTLLEMFIVFCVAFSFMTISDLAVNVIKDCKNNGE